jgi:hypothetical protein
MDARFAEVSVKIREDIKQRDYFPDLLVQSSPGSGPN